MKSFRSHTWALYPFVLMFLAIPASADLAVLRFDGTIGSTTLNTYNPQEKNAFVETYPGSSELQSLCCTWTGGAFWWYSFPTFTVPAGGKILDARVWLYFEDDPLSGNDPSPDEVLALDPNQPSLPGRISAPVATHNSVYALESSYCEFINPFDSHEFDLTGAGCAPDSSGRLSVAVTAFSYSWVDPSVIDPGFNSKTVFSIGGGNWTPIRGELFIIYTPEPLSLTLIGTGMVLIAGMARWRGTHGKTASGI